MFADIPAAMLRRQRDLVSAQFAEVQARASYAKALVEVDRSTGSLDTAESVQSLPSGKPAAPPRHASAGPAAH